MDKVLKFAKRILDEKIDKNSVVIDATCGNGKDTLFLVKSAAKKVYSFDIQKIAIEKTKDLLKNEINKNKCELILDSHENFDKYVPQKVTAIIFNLGYLPSGDHTITTKADITTVAVKKMLNFLEEKGIIIITVYWGHEEGKKEKEGLEKFLKTLDQKEYEVLKYNFINQKNNPPFLFIVERIK